LEQISFFTGLAAIPRVVRATVLFDALFKAYGVEPAQNKTGLPVEGRFTFDDMTDTLPLPSVNLPEVRVIPATPRADPETSPLAAQLFAATGEIPTFASLPSTPPPLEGWLRARGPSSPHVDKTDHGTRGTMGRDSIPPQVLPLLVPPFRSALLFLVRKDVAVGWDGLAPTVDRKDIRDVLLPLAGPSAFARAMFWGKAASGSPDAPTTVERILFRFLHAKAPRAFMVVPVRVGEKPVALVYVDTDKDEIDDAMLNTVLQVGATLADALSPLVANNTLFGPRTASYP
jgi:hypothetical protein